MRRRGVSSEGVFDQVNYIRGIYARFTVLIHEIAKFAVVGGIGFVVQMGVTDIAHLKMGIGPLKAIFIGYVIATAITFIGNRHWAFRHRKGRGLGRETVLFVVLNLIGLAIQEAVVGVVHYAFGLTDPISYNVANIVGIVLGTLFRLWSYRKWVFLAVPEAPADAEEVRAEPSSIS